MADFATDLTTRITGAPDVATLIGAKLFWNIVPQNTTLPYVRLQVISDPRPVHLDGYDESRESRVQCDCVAATHKAARAIAHAIIEATDEPATVGATHFGRTRAEGPRDLGEDLAGKYLHRANMDLLVRHRPA